MKIKMETNTMKKIMIIIAIATTLIISGCGSPSPVSAPSTTTTTTQPAGTATLKVTNLFYTTPIEIRWQNTPVMNIPASISTQTAQISPNTGNFYVFQNGIMVAVSRTITVTAGQTIQLTVGQGTMI